MRVAVLVHRTPYLWLGSTFAATEVLWSRNRGYQWTSALFSKDSQDVVPVLWWYEGKSSSEDWVCAQ